jgi:hypothetical protein
MKVCFVETNVWFESFHVFLFSEPFNLSLLSVALLPFLSFLHLMMLLLKIMEFLIQSLHAQIVKLFSIFFVSENGKIRTCWVFYF